MKTLQVNLSDSAAAFVEELVSRDLIASADAYLADLVQQDEARHERTRAQIIEGIESGIAGEWTPGFFSRLCEELIAERELAPVHP